MSLLYENFSTGRVKGNLLSLDLEYDYGGDEFTKHDLLKKLKYWSESTSIPINIFVEGRLLYDDRVLDLLIDWNGDINLHCFDHTHPFDRKTDIRRSQNLFSSVFGRKASGYRSTRYSLNMEIIDGLIENDFIFDSSLIFNPYRGNRHNTIKKNVENLNGIGKFHSEKGELVEFPIGYINYLYLPLVFSYVNIIGLRAFGALMTLLSTSDLRVIDFHLVDIEPNLKNLNMNDNFLIRSAYRFNSIKKNGVGSLSGLATLFDGDFVTYTDILKKMG